MGHFYIDMTRYVFWMESANENPADQLVGRPPGKPDTRIVLQEFFVAFAGIYLCQSVRGPLPAGQESLCVRMIILQYG